MRKLVVALAVMGALTFGGSHAVLASDYGTISVTGSAQETFVANEAVVRVSNRIEKDTVAEAKTENDRISAVFRQNLRDLGVADKDIRTTSYYIDENEREIGNTGKYKKTYIVNNIIEVTVTDKTKTSQVFDKAAAAGITDVQLAKFDYNSADKAALNQKLMLEAAKDARQKADKLAEALGTRVIGVESFYINGNGYREDRMYAMVAEKPVAAVEDSQSAIEYGDKTADFSVNVVFKVK